jgi:adenine deaminase
VDLLLTNARLVNVLSGEVYATDVAVAGPLVVGLGRGYRARRSLDLKGRYLCPGFIDAHAHLESSHLTPRQYARAVVPRGVTTVVADPHEVANVAGIEGVRYLLRDAATAPFTLCVMAPSCVPASPLATSGAVLGLAELAALKGEPQVLGLAEMMDSAGVVAGEQGVLAKIACFGDGLVDGHCPGLSGLALNAYAAAGITSDHEMTGAEEGREKLRAGLALFAREASGAKPPVAAAARDVGDRAPDLPVHRRPRAFGPPGRGLHRPPGPDGPDRRRGPGGRRAARVPQRRRALRPA